jgi:hypothetical protein
MFEDDPDVHDVTGVDDAAKYRRGRRAAGCSGCVVGDEIDERDVLSATAIRPGGGERRVLCSRNGPLLVSPRPRRLPPASVRGGSAVARSVCIVRAARNNDDLAAADDIPARRGHDVDGEGDAEAGRRLVHDATLLPNGPPSRWPSAARDVHEALQLFDDCPQNGWAEPRG